jgi:6-phosphofructokinase
MGKIKKVGVFTSGGDSPGLNILKISLKKDLSGKNQVISLLFLKEKNRVEHLR